MLTRTDSSYYGLPLIHMRYPLRVDADEFKEALASAGIKTEFKEKDGEFVFSPRFSVVPGRGGAVEVWLSIQQGEVVIYTKPQIVVRIAVILGIILIPVAIFLGIEESLWILFVGAISPIWFHFIIHWQAKMLYGRVIIELKSAGLISTVNC